MPFGPLFRPSIGLGLLKASLLPLKISTRILYLTLPFAERIGASIYNRIAEGFPATVHLVGEWIFSHAMFDQTDEQIREYIEKVVRVTADEDRLTTENGANDLDVFIQKVLEIRREIDDYLEECLSRIVDHSPAIVGFTSLFQQHLASLSLAKRVKAHLPETFIVFGGANCEAVMGAEMIRRFPFVDAAVSGEGDVMFPELVRRVLAKKSLSNLQGVFTQSDFASRSNQDCYLNAASIRDLDTLPIPEYDDYFSQLAKTHLVDSGSPRLQFETSRGCWWGEIRHCTFCGLNGSNMSYRSKSAGRALQELTYLTNKYPGNVVEVVDNILDMNYFNDFIPALAAEKRGLKLFYEVKSNLKKNQLRLLRDAGITEIQPGIESLSTPVLKLMRKGVSRLQNIQLLKWCKEMGVAAYWNLIWGFPGEPPEEYHEMAALIPLISHLPPPEAIGPLRLDRFSPNFRDADQLGFEDVVPYSAYRHIYPFPAEAISNLAYYFTFRYKERQDQEQYTKALRDQVAGWRKAFATSALFYKDLGDFLVIFDLRPIAQQRLTVVTEPTRTLYIECDRIRTADNLSKLVREKFRQTLSLTRIEELLAILTQPGMMLRDENSYLSLAIPLGDYAPPKALLEQFRAMPDLPQ